MYEVGLLVALLMWMGYNIILLVSINSCHERNLNKIGKRLSWVGLTVTELEQDDLHRSFVMKALRFLLIAAFGLPFVLLSWIYVFAGVGGFLYRFSRDSGVPQSVKEFRWRMRNVEMTYDQLVTELMKLETEQRFSFEEYRARLTAELKERGVYGSW